MQGYNSVFKFNCVKGQAYVCSFFILYQLAYDIIYYLKIIFRLYLLFFNICNRIYLNFYNERTWKNESRIAHIIL